MRSDLWLLLRDATRRGLAVSIEPGHVGAIRIEVTKGDRVLWACEPITTRELDYNMLTDLVRRAVFSQPR